MKADFRVLKAVRYFFNSNTSAQKWPAPIPRLSGRLMVVKMPSITENSIELAATGNPMLRNVPAQYSAIAKVLTCQPY